jgi:hypothetical protein
MLILVGRQPRPCRRKEARRRGLGGYSYYPPYRAAQRTAAVCDTVGREAGPVLRSKLGVVREAADRLPEKQRGGASGRECLTASGQVG